jgi:hypothetical protein
MAENLRTGMVWKHFMRAAEVRRGMKLAGFAEPGRIDDSRLATNH